MQEEKYGTRDRTYSAWHRRMSTRRFVGIEHAQLVSMIDLDACLYVEYDDGSKEPLALIETARDVGQAFKATTVTTNACPACGTRRVLRPLPGFGRAQSGRSGVARHQGVSHHASVAAGSYLADRDASRVGAGAARYPLAWGGSG